MGARVVNTLHVLLESLLLHVGFSSLIDLSNFREDVITPSSLAVYANNESCLLPLLYLSSIRPIPDHPQTAISPIYQCYLPLIIMTPLISTLTPLIFNLTPQVYDYNPPQIPDISLT